MSIQNKFFLGRTFRRNLSRMKNFLFGKKNEDRLQEELREHLFLQEEEFVRSGMPLAEARRQARLKLGSLETTREGYHKEAGLPFLETLFFDLRYAFRVLKKAPSFTLVAFLTLMLGIGANIIVFGLLNGVVLQPLAVSNPQNLYQIRPKAKVSGRLITTSYPAFEDIQKRNVVFTDIAGFYGYSHARLSLRGDTIKSLSGYEVTGNYFDMLGVQPQLGDFFHASREHGIGSLPYVVLSDALWRNTFQANPQIIGTTVELNKRPFTVVAVAPGNFQGTEKFRWPDYWMPLVNGEQSDSLDRLTDRASPDLTVIARLKPGVTQQQATENLNAIAAQLAKEYPLTDKGQEVRLIHPGLLGDDNDAIRGFLYGITALALLVLLAACTNLASLFSARAADRSRELALRIALGSSKTRLIRQLLTEAMLVSLVGGAAGLICASLALRFVDHLHSFGDHPALRMDARVCFAGLLFTFGSGLLIGFIPAKQAWRSSPLQSMKGSADPESLVRKFTLRDLLLGAQISICTLLIVASLIAVRGLQRALHSPLGIQPDGVMLAMLDLDPPDKRNGALAQKQKELLDAVKTIPGVIKVGAINSSTIGGGAKGLPVFREGTTEFTVSNSALETRLYSTSPDYLHAAGTKLVRGRDFSWTDTASAPAVAIVNDTFSRKLWGNADAIGQHFYLNNKQMEVVGVMETGKYHDLAESPMPAMFVPLSQREDGATVLVVRSTLTPSAMSVELRHLLSSLAPDCPLVLKTWTDELDGLFLPAKTATLSLGIMGLLAAMLALTGIFGTAAYTVSRRMKELGIRVALGARKRHVLRSAMGRTILLLTTGSGLGLFVGIAANRLMEKLVYQAKATDPVVLFLAVFLMAALGGAASALPARRALSINPSKLMRED